MPDRFLARIIHEGFYCNRRYENQNSLRYSFFAPGIVQKALDLENAVATHLTEGGLAVRSVNILFQVCLPSSRLRAPVSRGVSAVSSRTLVNNVGLGLDFVRDTLAEGQPFRVLRVLDQWSHQSPLREVGTRMSA